MIGVGLFVVFFFGLCIFVHELGHFLMARWRRMHIVAFSIGFIKAYGWTRGGIEYRLGWLPFGGYVDLPQIDATGQPKDKQGNPLPPAKPIDRILTAAAGPACNVLFGFALGAFLWWHGIPQDTPKMAEIVVAELAVESPEYQAGLRDGDHIVRLNGKSFYGTWNDLVREIIFTVDEVELEVLRNGAPLTISYLPVKNRERLQGENIAYPFFLPELPLIVQVRPDSPAAVAGMRNNDEILEVNGQSLDRTVKVAGEWLTKHGKLMRILNDSEATEFAFKVRRGEAVVEIPPCAPQQLLGNYMLGINMDEVLYAQVSRLGSFWRPQSTWAGLNQGDLVRRVNGETLDLVEDLEQILLTAADSVVALEVERAGSIQTVKLLAPPVGKPGTAVTPAGDAVKVKLCYRYGSPVVVKGVVPGSVAAEIGLQPGDQLLTLDGQPIAHAEMLSRAVQAQYGRPGWRTQLLDLLLRRHREAKPLSLTVMRAGQTLEFTDLVPQQQRIPDLGLSWVITNHPTPWLQMMDTVSMSYKSVRGIFAGFFGLSTLRPSHLSGPIGIVRAIGITIYRGGVIPALSLIVMITFSLAILNLMPFPVLDGGHIVMALYEQVFGHPVPIKVVQPLFTVFVVLLISLMLYVTVFDVRRMMPTSVSREYWLRPTPVVAGSVG